MPPAGAIVGVALSESAVLAVAASEGLPDAVGAVDHVLAERLESMAAVAEGMTVGLVEVDGVLVGLCERVERALAERLGSAVVERKAERVVKGDAVALKDVTAVLEGVARKEGVGVEVAVKTVGLPVNDGVLVGLWASVKAALAEALRSGVAEAKPESEEKGDSVRTAVLDIVAVPALEAEVVLAADAVPGAVGVAALEKVPELVKTAVLDPMPQGLGMRATPYTFSHCCTRVQQSKKPCEPVVDVAKREKEAEAVLEAACVANREGEGEVVGLAENEDGA